jgi:hypothetical protein
MGRRPHYVRTSTDEAKLNSSELAVLSKAWVEQCASLLVTLPEIRFTEMRYVPLEWS